MKCKISKMLFVALALGLSVSGYSQTESRLKKVLRETNVEKLLRNAEVSRETFAKNYKKAIEVAKKKGLQISGTNEDGSFFAVYGYDEENDAVLYKKTFNNVSNGSAIKTIKANFLHDIGIAGNGMNAGIWDGGVPLASHKALEGRVVTGNDEETFPTSDSHATHVGGTIASSGQGGGAIDLSGTKGIAYESTLLGYDWFYDLSEMQTAAANGLLVSNHSYGWDVEYMHSLYGEKVFGRYINQLQGNNGAKPLDDLLYDAPYYTSVWAAGNDRDYYFILNGMYGGRDLLTAEGVAKNNIVVAAINGIETYNGPGSVVMSSFSNWGPTDDFRVKPDISTKGVGVYSLSIGSDTSTATSPGTSMAAPSVTGGVVLWQQYYESLFGEGEFMRSATIKAVMAHTAMEAGAQEGPDYMYGWGVFNVEGGATVINNAHGSNPKALLMESELSQGQTIEHIFSINSQEDVRATLSWTDPSGVAVNVNEPANLPEPALVNDLDLRIVNVDTGEQFFPYRIKKGWGDLNESDINEKADNDADNIERVDANGLQPGNYKVVINHKGNLKFGPQKFTLVLTGHNGPLSAEEQILQEVFVPNPFSDYINIVSEPGSLIGAEVYLYDTNGRLLFNNKIFSDNDKNINAADYPSGIYIMTVGYKGSFKTYKLIKK